jgi:hypothetical protein
MTWKEAQQAIADKHGQPDFIRLIMHELNLDWDEDYVDAYQQAAELMCYENMRNDREKIIEANPTDVFQNGLGHTKSQINIIKLNKIPIPFKPL